MVENREKVYSRNWKSYDIAWTTCGPIKNKNVVALDRNVSTAAFRRSIRRFKKPDTKRKCGMRLASVAVVLCGSEPHIRRLQRRIV